MSDTRASDAVRVGPGAPLPHARWREVDEIELPRNIGAVLDRAAELYPDRLAWQFPELPDHPCAALTYRELVVEVDRMAAALAAAGVRRRSHVGAILANVPEFPLLWLALARLGAVIVPVNPLYRPRELDHVAERSEMTHLVAAVESLAVYEQSEHARRQIPADRVVAVGDEPSAAGYARLSDLLASVGDQPPRSDVDPDPDDLINIQFTSGTTGFPKGCMLTHRYWATLGMVGTVLSGGPQRMLADHPFFYMQNQAYLARALFAGAQLIVMPKMSRSRFFEWLETHQIDYTWYVDVMHTTPARPEDRETTLAFVSSAGVHGELHRFVEDRFGVPVRDSYASTELGPGLAVPIDRGDLMERPAAIGFPTPLREARIVDADLRELAPGRRGELLVRGPGMFLGYYGDPETTAKEIVDGWFRTGDLCSTTEDGCFYIHGRIKESVNRSGENIAAGEVEAVLRGIPHVDEVAVIGVPDDVRGQEVKAYLVPVPGHEDDIPPEVVLGACERELAAFKIPRYLEYRTELPMTASGKVAKATLAAEKEDLRTDSFDRVEGIWRRA